MGSNSDTTVLRETGNDSATLPVPKKYTPEEIQFIQTHLEIYQRLQAVEEKLARFESAMLGAAKMLLDNPMMSAMMPKEMKAALREATNGPEKKIG